MKKKFNLVIAGKELTDAITEIYEDLGENKPKLLLQGVQNEKCEKFDSFDDLMSQSSEEPINKSVRQDVMMNDTACYIYTSGTTG